MNARERVLLFVFSCVGVVVYAMIVEWNSFGKSSFFIQPVEWLYGAVLQIHATWVYIFMHNIYPGKVTRCQVWLNYTWKKCFSFSGWIIVNIIINSFIANACYFYDSFKTHNFEYKLSKRIETFRILVVCVYMCMLRYLLTST